MAEANSDQLDVAPPSGSSVAENTAALHAAAPEVAAASVAVPPTTDAIAKADEPNGDAADSAAPADAATAGPTDAAATETKTDKDEGAAAPVTSTDAAATNGTPSSSKKDNKKRKSISEPKGKSIKKKQSMRELHLNVEPGSLWWVRMKGYPNWPAIICDEDMLPATLLEKRPVSAARYDGSYREDFQEGGKNARDRRYPVMFLGTNEFYWQVNTDLLPLDIAEIKEEVAKGERGKKTVALWQAYQIASEEHDLDHFKELLKNHEEQLLQELQAKAEREAAKKDKEAKKEAKKSKAEGDEDVEMEDADDATAAKKKKTPSKKRKEPASADGEEEQKKEKKSKTKKDETPAKTAEPELSEQQKLEKKEKNVLYLRHRLQKGFLSRDQAPKEDEMAQMNDHIKALEDDPELEVSIIRNTKINKVLKAILKIDEIPKEDTYHFKERSTKLLSKWNAILGTPAEVEVPKPTLNGDSHVEEAPKSEEPKVEVKGSTTVSNGSDAKEAEPTPVAEASATEEVKADAPETAAT